MIKSSQMNLLSNTWAVYPLAIKHGWDQCNVGVYTGTNALPEKFGSVRGVIPSRVFTLPSKCSQIHSLQNYGDSWVCLLMITISGNPTWQYGKSSLIFALKPSLLRDFPLPRLMTGR